MRFVFLSSLMVSACLLLACDTTCPVGMQRYGRKCVDSPTVDAGRNAADGAVGAPGSSAGDGDSAAGDATQGMRDGGPVAPDAGDDSKVDSGAGPCVPPSCERCATNPCLNDGLCSPTATGYMCTCKVGFSGPSCAADVCSLDPCAHGACTRKSAGRTCNCDSGWSGEACEINTNATLANLTVSAGTLFPAFKANVYAYSVDLGISAPEIAVTPTAAVPDGVEVKIDGLAATSGVASELYVMGLNTSKVVNIEVQADDGTKLTYAVTVRRSLVQQAYLKGSTGSAGLKPGEGQTSSPPMVAVGNELFVGQTGGGAADPVAIGTGSVWHFVRSGSAWVRSSEVRPEPTQAGAGFGTAIAGSAAYLAVGAPFEDVVFEGATLADAGAVYVFRPGPTAWVLDQRIVSVTPEAQGKFGADVGVTGEQLLVGCPGAAQGALTNAGAIEVFARGGAGWAWKQTILASTPVKTGQLGLVFAVDADVLAAWIAGAEDVDMSGTKEPTIQVLRDVGGAWGLEQELRSDPPLDTFGTALVVAGGRIAATSTLVCFPGGCFGRPSIVIFGHAATWHPVGVVGPDAGPSVELERLPLLFGSSLAFDGTHVASGAYAEQLLLSGVNPSYTAGVTGHASDVGAVYLYSERANGWGFDAYIKASNAGGGDRFGQAVEFMDGALVVAAAGEASNATTINGDQSDNSADGAGAVYVFSTNCANVPAGASVPGC